MRDVTVALPRLVGGDGVLATFPQPLNAHEEAALQRSATVVREAISESWPLKSCAIETRIFAIAVCLAETSRKSWFLSCTTLAQRT